MTNKNLLKTKSDIYRGLKLSYRVTPRNGYYGIDEYLSNDESETNNRIVDDFRTRKQADNICRELNHLAYTINYLRGLTESL